MNIEDFGAWFEIVSKGGFLAFAWYLLRYAMPAKDAAHAEERRAWEAANAKMWDTFRADSTARADKYERLLAETHECFARMNGGKP